MPSYPTPVGPAADPDPERLGAVERTLAGKSVLLTGHTGFTGGWLAIWLHAIDCRVTGVALAPETSPNLFAAAGVGDLVASHVIDIRDAAAIEDAFARARPEVVFHLAAQPLVRRSYADPLTTFSVNAAGTANVLNAACRTEGVKAAISVTTDKVYENREWCWPYRENDPLGGADPYSASKACAEHVTRCYREALAAHGNGVRIAAVRGGNIIGGGDWSEDRIVPDFARAVSSGLPLAIRSPNAVRPWQHVLAACHGYMSVAAHLLTGGADEIGAWNIGPTDPAVMTVRDVVDALGDEWSRPEIKYYDAELREASFLQIDVRRIVRELGFAPGWTTREAVRRTAEWYREFARAPESALATSRTQIEAYRAACAGVGGAGDGNR